MSNRGISSIAWCAVMAAGLIHAGIAQAEPQPSPVPTAWELTLQPTEPTRIVVDLGGVKKTFWYFLYTVTNNTGQDVDFHPEIVRVSEIETEATASQAQKTPDQAPRITPEPAIIGLDSRVFKAIAERHQRTHPFLVAPVKAIERLLQGRDNARTSVAVFPDLDPRASKFTIYFGGLSGEQTSKPNPTHNPKKAESEDNPRFFVIRKTLAMPYTIPGDERTRTTAIPVLGRMTWVMR